MVRASGAASDAMSQPPIRDEKIAALETTIRFYAAQARRWEARCVAVELELCAAQERLAAAGFTAYGDLP
jgi:hypothetical protein